MKNGDKITMTVGQLKRLIRESINEQSYITYNDILDELSDSGLSSSEYKAYVKSEKAGDKGYGKLHSYIENVEDEFSNARNKNWVARAFYDMAVKLAQGKSFSQLRQEYGMKTI